MRASGTSDGVTVTPDRCIVRGRHPRLLSPPARVQLIFFGAVGVSDRGPLEASRLVTTTAHLAPSV